MNAQIAIRAEISLRLSLSLSQNSLTQISRSCRRASSCRGAVTALPCPQEQHRARLSLRFSSHSFLFFLYELISDFLSFSSCRFRACDGDIVARCSSLLLPPQTGLSAAETSASTEVSDATTLKVQPLWLPCFGLSALSLSVKVSASTEVRTFNTLTSLLSLLS